MTRKHIAITPETREKFDDIKQAFAQYLSTEGFLLDLLDSFRATHCPECSGALKTRACVCKAQERL